VVVAILLFAFPVKVRVPERGSYRCGSAAQTVFDQRRQTVRWAGDSLLIFVADRRAPLDRLPNRRCPNETHEQLVRAAGAGVIAGALALTLAATAATAATRRARAAPTDEPDRVASVTRRDHLAHVPALDGLRGVAVLAVLAYHAGLARAMGGFLGVDTFFVLSGYLITALLLAEWQGTGRIGLGRFWARRARRLLPALLLVLVGVAIYSRLIASRDELPALRLDSLATLGYFANWRFIFAKADYFTEFLAPSPLRHMWSLAVEEQFYLLWPPIALVVLRVFKSRRALLWVAVSGTVASAVLMLVLYQPESDPSRLYYGTDARMHTILIGVALATLGLDRNSATGRVRRACVLVLGTIGAVFLAWSFMYVDGQSGFLYAGGFLLVALAVAAILASVITTDSHLSRVLSLRPLRLVGLISYGVYLWHWPIFLVLTRARTGLSGMALLGARLGTTFAIATLSFMLLERPIRRGALRHGWANVATPAAVGITALSLIAVTAPRPARQTRATAALALARAQAKAASTTLPGQPGIKALLLGDSVALTLAYFLPASEQVHLVQRTGLGCGVARHGRYRIMGLLRRFNRVCETWPDRWRTAVEQEDPDVVAVLVGRWEMADRQLKGRWTHVGQPDFDTYLLEELERAFAIASSRGARVALLTTPYFKGRERLNGDRWPEDDPARVDRFNQLLRTVAARHPGVAEIIDLNGLLSPGGRYTKTIRGVDVRNVDGVHLASGAGAFAAPMIWSRLARLGAQRTEQTR
jgi:peptidoglycan/LPS O-acetylase OafA/YrhL